MQEVLESNTSLLWVHSPQQILTLCNVTCKYTRISCLVLYKLQEIVSRWDTKVLHGSSFRNLSEFLKEATR
jgi:hypothetical protein